MKKQELIQTKELGIKELKEKAKGLNIEMADLILDKNMKKLKDLKMIFKKRKDRAQILTIIRQKELLQELEPQVKEKSK